MLPGDVTWGVKAGVDVCHQLLGQGTGVAENATKEPQTGEVGPELQQICHPLPGRHGVQPDIGIANVYMFPRQVRVCGQAFSDPFSEWYCFLPLWESFETTRLKSRLCYKKHF